MKAIARFQVTKRIGGGGFGEVFLADDPTMHRQVAIKVFRPKDENLVAFATSSTEEGLSILRGRFLDEARILASLEDEPHVVNVHEYGELEDGAPFYVMPYLAHSLSERIGKDVFDVSALDGLPEHLHPCALPEHEALPIFEQLLRGMAAAHRKGLVHRDIKPSNIMFNEAGDVRLVDFGIAKAPDGQYSTVSHLGMGSRNYMAPEQRDSAKHVDSRADIYAFGVVAYRVLTGQLPVGRFPDPAVHARGIGPEINQLLLDCLSQRKEDRPQDGAIALEKFDAAVQRRSNFSEDEDTGTWVGHGQAEMRDELQPLRERVRELFRDQGHICTDDREELEAMAAIVDLDAAGLDALIRELLQSDAILRARARIAARIVEHFRRSNTPPSERWINGLNRMGPLAEWDDAAIRQLIERIEKRRTSKPIPTEDQLTLSARQLKMRRTVRVAVLVALAILPLVTATYLWRKSQIDEGARLAEFEQQTVRETITARWREAGQENSIESYQAFLREWPESTFADDAMARLDVLRNEQVERQAEQAAAAERESKQQRIAAAWASLLAKPELAEARQFIADFPDSAHQREALELVSQLERDARQATARAAEDSLWQRARNQDSETAFQDYLRQYPNGRHASQARAELERLITAAGAAEMARQIAALENRLANTVWEHQSTSSYNGYLYDVIDDRTRRENSSCPIVRTQRLRLSFQRTPDGVRARYLAETVDTPRIDRLTDRYGDPLECFVYRTNYDNAIKTARMFSEWEGQFVIDGERTVLDLRQTQSCTTAMPWLIGTVFNCRSQSTSTMRTNLDISGNRLSAELFNGSNTTNMTLSEVRS